MKNTLKLLPSAEKDVQSYSGYLQDTAGEEAADKFVVSLHQAFENLSMWPNAGVKRPLRESRFSELRVWPVRNFQRVLIFYRIAGSTVEIVRVLHSSRDIAPLFEEDM